MITIEATGAIEALTPEWDALVDRVDGGPFLRPGWFTAWWEAFGRGRLEILTARRDGQLAGVLPLHRHRRAFRSLTNAETPQFDVIAADDDARRALLGRVFAAGESRVHAFMVAAREDWTTLARESGYRVLARTLQQSPYVDVEGSWEEYLEGRPRRRRADLRRRRRRLAEAGEVAFDDAGPAGGLAASLEEFLRVEAAGWKGSKGTAIACEPSMRSFYSGVAEWAAARGTLRLWFLRIDGRAIASLFALEERGTLYMLKMGYDPEFARFSPGILLIEDGIASAFAHGLDRVELLGQADDYKLTWASGTRDWMLLRAYAASPLGRLEWTGARLRAAAGQEAARRRRTSSSNTTHEEERLVAHGAS